MNRTTEALDDRIGARITRSVGRTGRNENANARLTEAELKDLKRAAKSEGKALGEWNRDVLLREARHGRFQMALFTEVVALRILLNNVLRELAQGKVMTDKAYAQIINEVRTSKHEAARDLLAQYQPAKEGE